MRITNRMLAQNVINNINRNLKNMSRTQEQMSSGKLVNRPSDAPIVVARVLAFESTIAANDRYRKNMEDARGWIDASDSALAMASETMQRARDLAVAGANSTLPETSKQALAKEVDQLIDELVQTANASYGGRFLFGGSKTATEPFSRTAGGVVYNGNSDALNWEVAPGVTMKVNTDGNEAFMYAVDSDGDGMADQSLFGLLEDLHDALAGGDYDAVGDTLDRFEAALDHLLSARAVMGAKSNRLEMAISRLDTTQISLTKSLSLLEDIDLAETVMNYKNQENVYHASLATGAMVLQPSLIDYLR